MLDAYDFSDLGLLVDIGGGNGSLLTGVLQRHPKLRGILYDLPGVADSRAIPATPAGVRAVMAAVRAMLAALPEETRRQLAETAA